MYSVEFSKNAEKQLYKLSKSVQIRIINVLDRIKVRPYHFVKRKEGTPYFIVRIGEFRLVVDIDNQNSIIYIIKVGHRKNIYNK